MRGVAVATVGAAVVGATAAVGAVAGVAVAELGSAANAGADKTTKRAVRVKSFFTGKLLRLKRVGVIQSSYITGTIQWNILIYLRCQITRL